MDSYTYHDGVVYGYGNMYYVVYDLLGLNPIIASFFFWFAFSGKYGYYI